MINTPGMKEAGIVIQGAKRSEQLEGIAKFILFSNSPMLNSDFIKLQGYAEQLKIIADELRSEGK